MADFPGAIDYFVDSSRVFVNQNTHDAIVLHGCGSINPDQTAQELGDYFRTNTLITSVHYGIDRQGVICQYVREQDGAGGNCCTEPGYDPFWDQFKGSNLNLHTISIEHENDKTNSLPLTPVQQAASFKLVDYLHKKYNIPVENIKTHASIAPKTRAMCPGNYPMNELKTYLKGAPVSVPTTHGKEIGTFIDADQFQPAKSQGECGCFSVGLCKAMAPIGAVPAQTVPQVIAEAENWYQQIVGDNSINTYIGLDDKQVAALLSQNGLASTAIDPHAASIQAKVAQGYPVIICATEASIVDMALGKNPYPWTPAGNHIFVVTGIRDDGNFLVRDTANCTNLYDPNSLRAGPRSYTMGMEKLWAIAVTPHWLIQGGTTMTIPAGWKDDGKALTAPNGIQVTAGFRDYILSHNWDSANIPLQGAQSLNPVEMSNPSLGAGTQLICRWTVLEWTPSKGVFEAWIGQEIIAIRKKLSDLQTAFNQLKQQPTDPALQQQISTLQTQITSLQGKITQAKTALL